MINIIYEDNHLLVVEKKPNVLVQADNTNDLDLLTILKQYLKEKYNKPGNVYLGLVHRLDRPVGGVMVFAKTSKAASRLSEQVRTHQMKKEYQAVLCGKAKEKDNLQDYLLKDEKINMVKVDKNGKFAELDYQLIKCCDNLSLVKINLKTGRSHQIRVQFSSRHLPLWGDQRYNKNAKVGEQIALYATGLSFCHPVTKEFLSFKINTPDEYPWNMFKV